ncbi:MAG: hypothetical protein SGI77_06515 [Pirellulaceae bacterium]|nr:hypothetical protein [Pirellulaceae bacterium]
MKIFYGGTVIVLALATASLVGLTTRADVNPAVAATEAQSKTSSVLTDLKLEPKPRSDKFVGGPQEFVVTKKTVEFIKENMKDTVNNDGTIKSDQPEKK